MDISSKIRDFIVENFLFGEGESLNDDTSFMEAGIIDSTGILELIMFLEETYGIKIEDNELVAENFDNLQQIVRYVGRKLDPQCSSTNLENVSV
jgi:acyl carrier protein